MGEAALYQGGSQACHHENGDGNWASGDKKVVLTIVAAECVK